MGILTIINLKPRTKKYSLFLTIVLNLQIKILFSPSNSKFIIMSENLDATTMKPEGKGAAVGGFILSLIGIIVPFNVIAVLMGSAVMSYIGLVLCLLSVVLCAMAMGKLKKTGGKRGLAIAGLIIGLVATVWSAMAVVSINDAIDARNKGVSDLQRELRNM
ncbi:MAG: hypothetical protein K0S23_684 [Fluviicola sp.]|jgi:ABC-type maltose transport system permease subunit|nr:hypothetical protein [Fluviicola sp.]